MKLIVTENQLEKIIMEFNKNSKPKILQGQGNDPYQYKKSGNLFFFAKKGKFPIWKQAKNEKAIKEISKKFGVFDPMDVWKKSNTQLFSKNKETKKQEDSFDLVKGFKKWLRKTFPNVAQLFFARNLTENDFSDNQLKQMKKAVSNAIKRTGQTKGGTEYVDYGDNIVTDWFGHGGVKTKDMVINTLLSDPKFMVATTLGRFTYKYENGKLKITDIYDFKKIPDAKTKKEDLKNLNWPQKVDKIMKDNNVNPYVAIRHLGYLENPEESPSGKPKIDIEIPYDFKA
jgi:hypothetical protein